MRTPIPAPLLTPLLWLPPGAELVLSLTIPKATPSNNEIKAMHFAVYKKLRETFRGLVADQLSLREREGAVGVEPFNSALPLPLTPAWLCVERGKPGVGLDWDNAYGGLKPLLDCLVCPSPRNPSGLGLVADDALKHMPYPPLVLQTPLRRGEAEYTRIHLYSLPSTPAAQNAQA